MAAPISFNPVSLINLGVKGRGQNRLTHVLYAKLVRALIDGPCTYEDLVDETGLHVTTLVSAIRALRNEKLVRVCDWLPNGRDVRCVMVFEWAPGKRDVPMPRMTVAQRAKRYRDNTAKRALTQGMTAFHDGEKHVNLQD